MKLDRRSFLASMGVVLGAAAMPQLATGVAVPQLAAVANPVPQEWPPPGLPILVPGDPGPLLTSRMVAIAALAILDARLKEAAPKLHRAHCDRECRIGEPVDVMGYPVKISTQFCRGTDFLSADLLLPLADFARHFLERPLAEMANDIAFRSQGKSGMVCANLHLPSGIDMAQMVSHQPSGLALRMCRFYDINDDRTPARFDVLAGFV